MAGGYLPFWWQHHNSKLVYCVLTAYYFQLCNRNEMLVPISGNFHANDKIQNENFQFLVFSQLVSFYFFHKNSENLFTEKQQK